MTTIYREESRTVAVLDRVECDRCGTGMLTEHGNVNGVRVTGEGAFDGTHIPDGVTVHLDVCERCAVEWFATFKRNPLRGGDGEAG